MKNKLLGIVIALVVVCVIALLGIFGFDIPVYNFLRTFDWKIWDILGSIFSTKNWVAITLLLVVIFYVRKIIHTRSKVNVFDMYVLGFLFGMQCGRGWWNNKVVAWADASNILRGIKYHWIFPVHDGLGVSFNAIWTHIGVFCGIGYDWHGCAAWALVHVGVGHNHWFVACMRRGALAI